MDEGQQGVLLLSLPGAAEEQGARGGAGRPRAVLPPGRHAPITGRADLPAAGLVAVDHRWQRDRGRALPAHYDVPGRGEPEPPLLRRPRHTAGADDRGNREADRRAGRCGVRADREQRIDRVPSHRPRRPESPGDRLRSPASRSRSVADDRSRSKGSHRRRSDHRRPHRRSLSRRCAESTAPVRPRRQAPGRSDAAGRWCGWRTRREGGRTRNLVQLQLTTDALDRVPLRSVYTHAAGIGRTRRV